MRVFLDTNVLVAAFATRGLCADLLRYVLAEHALVVGEIVLTELRRVRVRRIKLPTPVVDDILEFLRAHEVVDDPAKPSDLPIRDAADRWIVASAVAARADVLVTGDQDLLALRASAPIRIVDPRGFWELARRTM